MPLYEVKTLDPSRDLHGCTGGRMTARMVRCQAALNVPAIYGTQVCLSIAVLLPV